MSVVRAITITTTTTTPKTTRAHCFGKMMMTYASPVVSTRARFQSARTLSKRRAGATPDASRRCALRVSVRPRASNNDNDNDNGSDKNKQEKYSNETKLRSEAQAPFRVARQFIYGACVASAMIGAGIASIQAATKAMGAPAAPPLEGSLENMAIDFTALALFAFLYKREDAAREKQMARIGREERLGRLRCELVGGKSVRLEDLRGFSRVVVVCGDEEYVKTAIEDAEAVREDLVKRGVLIVPVLSPSNVGSVDAPGEGDRKFRATPLRVNEWIEWVEEQKQMAKVDDASGVYVGLRMDGRVRSSGKGRVPFNRFAVELPPVDSWGGALDGFDGRVGVDS